MTSANLRGHAQQTQVDAHFASTARFWSDVYRRTDAESQLYKTRLQRALQLLDGLKLAAGARALDIGAGAGVSAVALATRGLDVDAIDSVDSMIALIMQRAQENGLGDRVHAQRGDAHALSAQASTYKVVLALGVFPWLHSQATAMREIARVLKPGGWLIASCSNRRALSELLEPMHNPMLEPLRRFVAQSLRRSGLRKTPQHGPRPRMQTLRSFDQLLASAGLQILSRQTLGFGPFSFLNRRLPDRIGLGVGRRLQALADARVPVLRSVGVGYLVLAQKPIIAEPKGQPE